MSADHTQSWEDAVRWLIGQPDQAALVEACYFDPPLAGAVNRYWQSDEWLEISTHLPSPPGMALDLGAGNGLASFALAKDGWRVDAVEPDPSDLVGAGAIRSLAQDHDLPIEVHGDFGEKLQFADARFDLVFARQVLHHARSLPQLCGELFRVLKPGGVLVAVRDHVISRDQDLPAFLDRHPLHRYYGGENAYRLDQYVSSLVAAGFVIRKTLGPLSSAINLAPMDRQAVTGKIAARLSPLPFAHGLARLITLPMASPALLRQLERIDSRPGRLYSFVCAKP
jgi:SAM-dependent methyltransferase